VIEEARCICKHDAAKQSTGGGDCNAIEKTCQNKESEDKQQHVDNYEMGTRRKDFAERVGKEEGCTVEQMIRLCQL
jgi:hypothetical protein